MHVTIMKMAFRNLVKNRRRSLITLFGIAFGVMLSILFTGLQDATWGKTINTFAELGAGHVVVQHQGYMDEPSVANRVQINNAMMQWIKADPHIQSVRERIISHAMVATAAHNTGAMLYGIAPETDTPETMRILKGKLEGRLLSADDDNGIVIGAELAKRLNIKLGQKLVVTLTDKDGEIVSALGRLRGILTTGSPSFDKTLCLWEVNALRKLIGYAPNEVTQLAVYLHDYRDSRDVARHLSQKMSTTAEAANTVRVLPWQITNADLFGLVETKMASAKIFEFLILLLVAAGIFNTLYVSVMERMREFGILNAIGFSRPKLFALVVWESAFTAMGGLVLAVVITALPYYYLNTTGLDLTQMAANGKEMIVNGVTMTTVIHVDIYFEKLLIIFAVAAGATLLSGLYPAYRAGNVAPVESIKLV